MATLPRQWPVHHHWATLPVAFQSIEILLTRLFCLILSSIIDIIVSITYWCRVYNYVMDYVL